MANRSAFGWSWSWGPITLALIVLAAVLFGRFEGAQQNARNANQRVTQAQQQLQTALGQIHALRAAAQLIAAPGTLAAKVHATPPAAQGDMYLAPGRAAIVIASDLPAAPSGQGYELWVLPAAGNPVPAGMFHPGADGAAVFSSPTKVTAASGLAVSLEPEAGSPQPTGPIVLAAKF